MRTGESLLQAAALVPWALAATLSALLSLLLRFSSLSPLAPEIALVDTTS